MSDTWLGNQAIALTTTNHDGSGVNFHSITVETNLASVPEASTFALLGMSGLALVGYGVRRKQRQAA
ncbi:PEP-CTERM sorting domain-containing protein [Symmachiella macrocystis]|uniref:PEP-CTERM sorting domain-containing protein n=1 Tax=Symmachiella macrocystis TaxID=2527985 RepID=UPI0018D41ACA|nr:PEP-CTERM sorting domain-containing protein [Symmachiella macrocystis]